jgi:phage baseplate assembly protein V
MIDLVIKLMDPLKRRVNNMVSRVVLNAITDTGGLQKVKLTALAEEELDNIDRVQEYGFTSNPKAGAEGVALFVGGYRDHGIIIAVDDRRYRLKPLASGEVAIYTDEGDYVWLKRSGQVRVKAGTKVTVEAPDAEFTGNVKVDGNLEVVGNSDTGGDLSVTGASELTGDVTAVANVLVGGNVVATGTVAGSNVSGGGTSLSDIKSTFNSHTHPENGTGGGTTSAPNQNL